MSTGTSSQLEKDHSSVSASSSEFSSAKTAAEIYIETREATVALCAPLETEDFGVQPMPDASPPKWHLAHTTWFFETFLLKSFSKGYKAFHPDFAHLFNSYYNGIGKPFPRAERGNLSRPTVEQVMAYRQRVDAALCVLLETAEKDHQWAEIGQRLELGVHHEQQHQELLLTDIKYNFGHNPLFPSLNQEIQPTENAVGIEPLEPNPLGFDVFEPGLVEIGATSDFCFDNELPRHRVYVAPFSLANRLVTNGEFLAFIRDGGYSRPDLWLSEAWSARQNQALHHPLYWRSCNDEWFEYQLNGGLTKLQLDAPAVHINGYEAAAFAAWSGARLPTEFEWEVAAKGQPISGNFVESGKYHPVASTRANKQMFGDVWEWTSSSYGAYPGYRPLPGVLGEYNGKFMSSQWVLRGGSCATPRSHIRPSYRNFFYPKDAWQFSGIRLAQDL